MTEFNREMMATLLEDARSFRAVTILGPRQSGKTTLAKAAFPNYTYVSLEELDTRRLAEDDPRTFLKRYKPPVIIDEVQRVPSLLSFIQGVIDDAPDKKGQYILTGSHQPILRESIAQSLAGRTSLLTLYPLSFWEVNSQTDKFENELSEEWIYRGFMPEIYRADLDPTRMYQAYTQTYVEKDVRQLIQIKEQNLFEKFLKLVAGRIGQLINYDSLASDVGVSAKTIKEWISILEASFILFRLPPFYKNIGKRLIKAPKIYFVDVGLAAYLLGIENSDQVARDPLFGQLFENMIVSELYKKRFNKAKDPKLFFYRDSHKNEVDIIFEKERKLIPLEIKSSSTFNPELIKNLNFFFHSVSGVSKEGFLAYSGETGMLTDKVLGLHFTKAGQCFDS